MAMTQEEVDIRSDERARYSFKVLEALVCSGTHPRAGGIADRLGLGHVYQVALADYEGSGHQWDEVRLVHLLNETIEQGERWRERCLDPINEGGE